MKYYTSFLIALGYYFCLYAQYSDIPVKENFDYLSEYNKFYDWKYVFYDKQEPNPFQIDTTLNNRMGDKYADVLSSLLRMYQTTGDKAYLHFEMFKC